MKLTSAMTKRRLHNRYLPVTWAIVANLNVAYVFSKQGQEIEHIAQASRDEIIRDPHDNRWFGRIKNRYIKALAHHKYELPMSSMREGESVFARQLVDWLVKAEHKGLFDQLVLIADPRMLGDLRAVIPKSLRGRIIAEFDTNLVGLSKNELHEKLSDILWF